MSKPKKPLILASQSPRRVELLKKIIKNFLVIPSGIDEVCSSRLSPEENAIILSRKKADWVANRYPHHWVIGADTLVVLENETIGKPTNLDDAHKILKRLSGRKHKVITGITVVHSETLSAAIVSQVNIKTLNKNEIASYINSGESMDKAGAYAIQGKGASLVKNYEGSYSNIVGLPIDALKDLLQKSGFPLDSSS